MTIEANISPGKFVDTWERTLDFALAKNRYVYKS